ncbi:DUF3868 domain-containing protein [Parabacteroides sp. OttesenSCG-928-G07]|nr:DUF3868 domain-containing protein [Parabacteroides sp. OttesenSCG-928-G07]
MKKILNKYMAVALLAVSSMALAAQTSPVTVTSNELKLRGNTVHIDATIQVDADYVHSKKSLTLTPVLESDNQKIGLPSVLLNGKNRQKVYEREIALGNSQDEPRYAVIEANDAPQHTIAYKTTIPWEAWMANARFVLTEDLCGCGDEESDLIPIADRIDRIPDQRYQPSPMFAYVQPEVETRKERAEVGTAYLEFVVGRYEIRPTFRNNEAELGKIKASIETVANDDNITTDGVWLKGFASPEGSYASNTRLADNRVKSLRDYIARQYKFNNNFFTLESEPEDWAGFKEKAEADQSIPNRSDVLAIINSSDAPDAKEAKLRQLPEAYRYVLNEIFPSLRRTDYRINYTVRGFDLAEAREIIKTRPQHLSLDEMYAVANSYEKGSTQYNEVFEIAVRMFSSDPTANLNAANIAMSKGDLTAARRYLASAGNTPQATHARGILALLEGNYTEAERLLEQAKAAGVQEAGANLEELRKKLEDNALFDSFQ